jgi:hypothetical protein
LTPVTAALGVTTATVFAAAENAQDNDNDNHSNDSESDTVEKDVPQNLHMDGEAPLTEPSEEDILFGTSTIPLLVDTSQDARSENASGKDLIIYENSFHTTGQPHPFAGSYMSASEDATLSSRSRLASIEADLDNISLAAELRLMDEDVMETIPTPPPPMPDTKNGGGVSFVDDSAGIEHTVVSSTYSEDRQEVTRQDILDPYGDKGRYTGMVLQSTGMPHGPGLMEYEEHGRTYEGEWRHGRYVRSRSVWNM